MITALYVLMVMAIIAIGQTYLLFPWWIVWSARKIMDESEVISSHNYPMVSILMAIHNEEKVLNAKLESIFQSHYPLDRIQIWIGNDNSTDNSLVIVRRWQEQFENIHIINFQSRTGKPAIINSLAAHSKEMIGDDQYFVLTDANVIFDVDMLTELMKANTVPMIGLVGANVIFRILDNQGVSATENTYNNRELNIKSAEGRKYGTMMGPFGACFSMKASLWKPVPEGFIVDDFWTNMSVLRQQYGTVLSKSATAYEDIVGDSKLEYRRKVRMSSGNFQNLSYFSDLIFSPQRGLSYCYWSHKILRWLTPMFLISIYLLMWTIFGLTGELKQALIVVHIMLLLMLIDVYLEKWKIRIPGLRALRHFFMMNLAILQGWILYITHRTNSIWQPTARQ